jgi:ATP-dependent DNA helicase HFM1/MER3
MLAQGSEQIESSLHLNFVEHLNAEIRLGTISDSSSVNPSLIDLLVNGALDWLRSTFLFVRIQSNPTRYGFSA